MKKMVKEIKNMIEWKKYIMTNSFNYGFRLSMMMQPDMKVIDHRVVDGIEVDIIYCPEVLCSSGYIIAGMLTLNNNGQMNKVILVDDHFKELSTDTQNFIIDHEIGHLIYDHRGGNVAKRILGFNELILQEIEADAYASDKNGKLKAMRSIREIYQMLPIDSRIACVKEWKMRYKAIKAYTA